MSDTDLNDTRRLSSLFFFSFSFLSPWPRCHIIRKHVCIMYIQPILVISFPFKLLIVGSLR